MLPRLPAEFLRKARILIDQISRALVTQSLIGSRLGKFVKQGVQLARVKRVGQLTDQVSGTEQAAFGIGSGIGVIDGYREARHFDGQRNPFLVDLGHWAEPVAHHNLGTFDVIRGEKGIRGAAWRRDPVAVGVDDEAVGGVAGADAADIADIVGQSCQQVMEPVLR